LDDLLDARGGDEIVDDVRFFRRKKRPRQPPRDEDDDDSIIIVVVNIILAGAPAHAFGLELFGENSSQSFLLHL
jgi:hypothetical protein